MYHSARKLRDEYEEEFVDLPRQTESSSSDDADIRRSRPPTLSPAVQSGTEEDGRESRLMTELEAALLADLESVSESLVTEAPAAAADEAATLDAEVLERLLASIRSPATRSEPEPESHSDPESEPEPELPPAAAATPCRRAPRSAGPRPVARPSAAADLPSSPTGRRLYSSLIVGAGLLALAGGGAFVTVQSVADHGQPEPAVVTVAPKEAPVAKEQAAQQPAVPEAAQVASKDVRSPSVGEMADASAPPASVVRLVSLAPDATGGSVQALDPSQSAALLSAPEPGAADARPLAVETPVPSEKPEKLAAAESPPAAASSARPAGKSAALSEPAPGPGRITDGVKLRANPDNGAPVIGLLGPGTAVQIVGCKGWCEVVAGEKRGFVYRRFLAPAG